MTVSRRLVAILQLTLGAVCTASLSALGANPNTQCADLKDETLIQASRKAEPTLLRRTVLPGAAIVKVEIPKEVPKEHVLCVRFLPDSTNKAGKTVRVVSVAPLSEKEGPGTGLALEIPPQPFGWKEEKELLLVSFKVSADGKLDIESPGVAVMQKVQVSSRLFAVAGAWLAALLAYVFAALTLGKGAGWRKFDPVVLTADSYGKANLGQLQIFGFSLVVVGLLVYVLLRLSVLSDLSADILLLLGVSAVGAAGGRVAHFMTRRVSFENWAWLRNHGWLTIYEEQAGEPSDAKRPRWADVLKCNDSFDVYSFQLATISVVVALALMWSDLDTLATFSIPPNILALLGLSNAVYIGGRAVGPDSIGELDKKLKALRDQALDWLTEAGTAIAAEPDPGKKLQAAKAAAPSKYQAYMVMAREAARMLKSLYGPEGTKFKSEPITDDQLLPSLP